MMKLSCVFGLMAALSGCGLGAGSAGEDAGPKTIGEALSGRGVYYATLTWEPAQLKAGNHVNNMARVTIHDPTNQPLASAVTLIGFHPQMPGMGHGTNEADQVISAVDDAVGRYVVSGVHFSMAGAESEWVVTINAAVAGTEDTAEVPLPAVE